jgi:large repetitive protein
MGNTLTGDRGTTYGGTDLGGGITINPGGAADVTYDIENNTITGAVSSAITLNSSNTSVLHGTLNANAIGTAGTVDSGSSQGDGINITAIHSSAQRALVTKNVIKQYSNLAGINISQSSGSPSLQAVVQGNTISNPGTFAAQAIFTSAGAATNDGGTMCLDLGGSGTLSDGVTSKANSFAGVGAGGTTDFRVRQRFLTTLRLPGYGGGNQDTTAVVSFIQGRNTGSPSGNATVPSPFTGGGFVGGASCVAP